MKRQEKPEDTQNTGETESLDHASSLYHFFGLLRAPAGYGFEIWYVRRQTHTPRTKLSYPLDYTAPPEFQDRFSEFC